MPGARVTNNSVSSVEQQTDLINAMAEQTTVPVKISSKSDIKKAKKRKARTPAETPGRGADLETARREDGDNVSIGPVEQEEDDIVAIAPQLGLQQPLVQPTPGLGLQPNQAMGGGFPLPYFYPPQLYGRPMDQYMGMGQNMMFQDAETDSVRSGPSEEAWEAQSTASSSRPTRQPTHSISDDEGEKDEPKRDFSGLKTGRMATLLKTRHEKAHQGDIVGPEINETLAGTINDFYLESKVTTELEKLSKDYPRIKNIPKVRVAKLDAELFTAIDHNTRQNDVALQNLQRGLVSAIAAMAPVAAIFLERGEADSELEKMSDNVLDAMQMVAMVDMGLSSRRRELIRPSMQQTYARTLAKGLTGSPEWLYGGNLSQEAKKCEEAKRTSEKLMKGKPQQNPQNNGNPNQNKGAGRGQAKRFKFKGKQTHFNPRMAGYQSFPQVFPSPQQVYQQPYQHFQQYPQTYQGHGDFRQKSQRQMGQQSFTPQQQDFQKRGPKK